MNKLKRKHSTQLYLVLSALFITTLVTCNLIANKFVSVDLGFKTFIISAGVLPYPITFLITDILSEIYGRKKTNWVVISGLAASALVLAIVFLGNNFNAIPESPVSDEAYSTIFGNSWRIISASMSAYLIAQLVDVRVYHFWKKLTKGKYLWLRNNGSTVFSQLLDTILVILVLFYGVEPNEKLLTFIIDGWIFKALIALLDTPIFYVIVYSIRKYFGLKKTDLL